MEHRSRNLWMLAVIATVAGMTLLVAALPPPTPTLAAPIRVAAASSKLFVATLSSSEEVPVNSSTATGFGTVLLSEDETSITLALRFEGLSSNQVASHIHGPAPRGVNAPILFNIGAIGGTGGTLPAVSFAVTPAQVANLRAGLWYFNIHSSNFPGGEIRGQIAYGPAPGTQVFSGELNAAQEVPTNSSTARGFGTVELSEDETQIFASLRFEGLSSNQIAAHIHGPAAPGANAPVLFNFGALGGTSGAWSRLQFAVTPAQVADLKAGRYYFNIHSNNLPGGEIRGQIGSTCAYRARLDGSQEVPANTSTAIGFGTVVLEASETALNADLAFAGLGSNQVASHIHGPGAPGVNAPIVFNIGSQNSTNGLFNGLRFAITPAQLAQLRAGQLYFNVHSATLPGGEIRGQIVADCTPSPPASPSPSPSASPSPSSGGTPYKQLLPFMQK